jgi:molybdopterin-guanine dinucleotide biosynthesis protein A
VTRSSGILLAGGAARRFGRPKHIALVDGMPLFHLPLVALRGACDEVLVVIAPDAPEPGLPAGVTNVRYARDGAPHEGPLSGAVAGLLGATGDDAAIAGADMPGLTASLVELMLGEARRRARAVTLGDGRDAPPLPAVVPVDRAREVGQLVYGRGERRLRALMTALEAVVLPKDIWSSADPEGAWRQDVDTPGDLPSRSGR